MRLGLTFKHLVRSPILIRLVFPIDLTSPIVFVDRAIASYISNYSKFYLWRKHDV
ncbi:MULTISPECIES: hypothetical protein [unclassified Microcoleus]|uniref:hypothetical protein n=1 Tax=unclassified Microcoleus TaxID=2642155 RepID=UPI0025EDCF4B|nr:MULTISPECIES: hypothetical protein [unclassified Microcoleus]